MAKYSARRAFFWQLIAKNRKRRLALHTALCTGYQRRQLLVQVACLTVLLLANNNGAAVLSRSCHRLQRNANLWTTESKKRFKEFRISRSTFKFLLDRIRNAIEKDIVTEEPGIDLLAIPGSEIVFVQRMLVRGEIAETANWHYHIIRLGKSNLCWSRTN